MALPSSSKDLYFIADIASNHNGSLQKAIDLIHKAAESGANAAKFQNFKAETIVSAHGFSKLEKGKSSHQASWKESVFETYKKASLPLEWTPTLKAECDKAGIDYLTSPYDLDIINYLSDYVSSWKIGSGDITWTSLLKKLVKSQHRIILATGASDLADVIKAVDTLNCDHSRLTLMQCNTNYTASYENYQHINLNVLKTYSLLFPDVTLGLSDHTPSHSTVLGAIALGATSIEKHFTLDNSDYGPDHAFSITPDKWQEMVHRSDELSLSLGSATKKVEANELETVVLQRRCLRSTKCLPTGHVITSNDVIALRPAPVDSLAPTYINHVIGATVTEPIAEGDFFKTSNFAHNNVSNSNSSS